MFFKNNPGRQNSELGHNPALRLQYYCLLAAGGIECLFLILGNTLGYVMYYYVESYLLIPCMLFLGITLTQDVSRQAKRQLLLSLAMVGWFVITQSQHKMQGTETKPIGMFFCVYLLAFPFASITRDGTRQRGLKRIAWLFIAVSMTLVLYSTLLLLNLLPSFLEPHVIWDGARLQAMWHPNICACLFMIGIALCFGFFFQFEKMWQKCLLLTAVALQFVFLALTNCRTSIFMTCGLVGGIVFFTIWKSGWKRFVVGLAAALAIMAALFVTSSTLYKAHNARLLVKYTEQTASAEEWIAEEQNTDTAEEADETGEQNVDPEEQITDAEADEPVQLQGVNGQGSLSNDLRTLNGRTVIWESALEALRDTPSLLIWGTEYVGIVISAYNYFDVDHAHNSWAEILFRMGLPGFVLALILTGIAVWNALSLLWVHRDMWKTCISLLVLCMLVTAFLEPFLFSADISYQYLDFFFFLCIGYMTQWRGKDAEESQIEKG